MRDSSDEEDGQELERGGHLEREPPRAEAEVCDERAQPHAARTGDEVLPRRGT